MGAPDAKELQEIVKKRFELWRQVVQAGDFVRGSVVVLRRPCTYRNCRLCRDGKRHPATYLSVKEKGRTRLIYLPKGLIAQAREWVAQWRRLEEWLGEMSRSNAQMLRLLAKRQARQGRRPR